MTTATFYYSTNLNPRVPGAVELLEIRHRHLNLRRARARAVIPLAAGILHIPNSRFWVANMVSANVWGPGVLFPGANSRKGCRSPRGLVRAA
jgi:hypothetical protein